MRRVLLIIYNTRSGDLLQGNAIFFLKEQKSSPCEYLAEVLVVAIEAREFVGFQSQGECTGKVVQTEIVVYDASQIEAAMIILAHQGEAVRSQQFGLALQFLQSVEQDVIAGFSVGPHQGRHFLLDVSMTADVEQHLDVGSLCELGEELLYDFAQVDGCGLGGKTLQCLATACQSACRKFVYGSFEKCAQVSLGVGGHDDLEEVPELLGLQLGKYRFAQHEAGSAEGRVGKAGQAVA